MAAWNGLIPKRNTIRRRCIPKYKPRTRGKFIIYPAGIGLPI